MDPLLIPHNLRRAIVAMDHVYHFVVAAECGADRAYLRAEIRAWRTDEHPAFRAALLAFLDQLDAEDALDADQRAPRFVRPGSDAWEDGATQEDLADRA